MCRTGEVADRTGVLATGAVDSRGKANRGRGRCDCRMDQHLMAKLAASIHGELHTSIGPTCAPAFELPTLFDGGRGPLPVKATCWSCLLQPAAAFPPIAHPHWLFLCQLLVPFLLVLTPATNILPLQLPHNAINTSSTPPTPPHLLCSRRQIFFSPSTCICVKQISNHPFFFCNLRSHGQEGVSFFILIPMPKSPIGLSNHI